MYEKLIIGAIAGDMIGARHEGKKPEPFDFSLISDDLDFTSDSVMTVAVMDSLLNGREYTQTLQYYSRRYPKRGYGNTFIRWLRQEDPKPYNSWNNGAAIRISPIGYAGRTVSEVLEEARNCAGVSHNHPDGIKGAQAVAVSVFMAKNGRTKDEIREYVQSGFGYNLNKTIDEIRPGYYYDQSCQGSVPEAIIAFLESTDYESAIRLAISLGGKSSTLACITGGIAQAFYKEVPVDISGHVLKGLSREIFETVDKFSSTYPISLFI